MAAHSAYDICFLGFWSGNLFLIAPFPDLAYLYLLLDPKLLGSQRFLICRGLGSRNDLSPSVKLIY